MNHCPKCDAIYQPHWTRCLICGFDGGPSDVSHAADATARDRTAVTEPTRTQPTLLIGVAIVVAIVLVGAVVAGIGPFGESDSDENSDRDTAAATTQATPESSEPDDSSATTSAADSWIVYTHPGDDFSVELPSDPTVEVHEFDADGVPMRETDYLSYDENQRYVLSHLEPVDPARVPAEDTEAMFALALEEFLESAPGEPHEERGETAGYPSISFGSANNGISVENLVVAAGSEYFSLNVSGVTELIDVPRYFESFRVLD